MPSYSNEQRLVDISFQLVLALYNDQEWLKKQSRDQVVDWTADQLRQCGFDTKPVGSSHGFLQNHNPYK